MLRVRILHQETLDVPTSDRSFLLPTEANVAGPPRRYGFLPTYFNRTTLPHSSTQRITARPSSTGFGEKIRKNPFPLTNAAKLDTQNGITNNRNVGQNPRLVPGVTPARVLITSAKPMIRLIPSDVSHNLRFGSK